MADSKFLQGKRKELMRDKRSRWRTDQLEHFAMATALDFCLDSSRHWRPCLWSTSYSINILKAEPPSRPDWTTNYIDPWHYFTVELHHNFWQWMQNRFPIRSLFLLETLKGVVRVRPLYSDFEISQEKKGIKQKPSIAFLCVPKSFLEVKWILWLRRIGKERAQTLLWI